VDLEINIRLESIEQRLEAIETILQKVASEVNDIERDMKKKVPIIGSSRTEPVIGQGQTERYEQVNHDFDDIAGLPGSMQKHARHVARDTDPDLPVVE